MGRGKKRVLHCKERKKKRKPKKHCRQTMSHQYAKTYAKRDEWLQELGFDSYRTYLNSNLWKDIRRRQLRKKPNCVLCGEPAITAHHVRYTKQNLSGKDRQGMVSICHKCHHLVEFGNDEKKLTLLQAAKRFRELAPHWNMRMCRFKGHTLGKKPKDRYAFDGKRGQKNLTNVKTGV